MFSGKKAKSDKALWFIQCKEMTYPVTKSFCNKLHIFSKTFHDLRIHPSASFIDFIRKFPVIQSYVRFNSLFQKFIDQCIIKINSFFIYFPGSFRQHTGPVNGKAVPLQPQFFHVCHVFSESVVMIAGYISSMAFIYSSRLFCKNIPDILSFSGISASSLYLIGTGRCSPHKIFCKSHIGTPL